MIFDVYIRYTILYGRYYYYYIVITTAAQRLTRVFSLGRTYIRFYDCNITRTIIRY